MFVAIGCETPESPENGYLSSRNATHAEFLCNTRYVFSDTLLRSRSIQCLRRHEWNDFVPDCIGLYTNILYIFIYSFLA